MIKNALPYRQAGCACCKNSGRAIALSVT